MTDNRAIIFTPHFKTNTASGAQVGASYLHNTGAGRENDNCVGLKLATSPTPRCAPHCETHIFFTPSKRPNSQHYGR